MRLLTEAIPQQIWRTDKDGSFEYANRDLLDYVGLRNPIGEGFYDIFHPEDRVIVKSGWEGARVATNKFECKARVRGADRTFRWFLIRANPQFDEEGAISAGTAFISILRIRKGLNKSWSFPRNVFPAIPEI